MYAFQDWRANTGRPHVQVLLVLFRTAQLARGRGRRTRLLSTVLTVLYRAVSLFMYSIDIPVSTRIGKGLTIHHGMGLVVHSRCVIGENVTLRQSVTIGTSTTHGGAPVIGSRVNIGANSVILGEIEVGDDTLVGAGSVVTRSASSGSVLAGNPARIVRHRSDVKG
jgi:serine acetyltransferase